MATTDRSDPAVRAAERCRRTERRQRRRRAWVGRVLLLACGGTVALGEPLPGDGAWVGVIVTACALGAIAAAVWPAPRSPAERRHHELDAIWRELRLDGPAPWPQYLAWAVAAGDRVELRLITRAADARPSPYSVEVVERVGGADVITAAERMEHLREQAAAAELEARLAYERSLDQARERKQDQALADVERAAEAYERRREQELEAEFAAQEVAERRSQAEAVARALRKP